MRVPEPLVPLVDMGVIDEVLRPLMAGKEAQVFLVRAAGEIRVAKVYKEAQHRSFKHRSMYAEGRQVRNTRRQRAMNKHSKYGRAEEEAAWRSAEVDAVYRLAAAGVAVPVPHDFIEGVFVMSLIADERGEPAPRLIDLTMSPREAEDLFEQLIREVVKMLCAGLIHGDLSDFNVLLGVEGPVIIDFPQAVDAASNNNARKLLLRDVRNLQLFLSRFAPGLKKKRYAEEIWSLYERGNLLPDSALTGRYKGRSGSVDTSSVLREIAAADKEEQRRREDAGLPALQEKPPLSKYQAKKQAKVQATQHERELHQRQALQRAKTQASGGGKSRSRLGSRSKSRSESRPEAPTRSSSPSRSKSKSKSPSRAKAPAPRQHTSRRRQNKPPPAESFPLDLDALLIVED